MIAPDTAQNIRVMIDLIFLHNFQAIVYAIGIVISILISIYKPSRAVIFMLLGFIILLFAFEYTKHIAEPLKEQTLGSLVTARQSPRIERIVHIVLMRLLPLVMPIVGWIFVAFGIFTGALNLKKEKKPEGGVTYITEKPQYNISPQQRKLLNHMVESIYEFKKDSTPLARLLGNLEATLKLGDFSKSINFDDWYKIIGRLESQSAESITYESVKTDIDDLEEFLTHILQNS